MPRIEVLRVFRWLWVAWSENDFGRRSHQRVWFSSTGAYARCLRSLYAEGGQNDE